MVLIIRKEGCVLWADSTLRKQLLAATAATDCCCCSCSCCSSWVNASEEVTRDYWCALIKHELILCEFVLNYIVSVVSPPRISNVKKLKKLVYKLNTRSTGCKESCAVSYMIENPIWLQLRQQHHQHWQDHRSDNRLRTAQQRCNDFYINV